MYEYGGDERMESLIQEAYEQIPVYLRNGRDMNRKGGAGWWFGRLPGTGTESVDRGRNSCSYAVGGNASDAGKIDLRKNIRIQWKVYGNFLDQGRLSQIHGCHCGFTVISIRNQAG